MKRRETGKRQISIVLAAAMLFLSVPPMEGMAASKPGVYGKMTDSYKDSVYYERLMEVELTGNQVTDLIAVAASQLGYTEGTDKNDLSGNGKGSGDCTEYGNWLGKNKLPWCASFVSWCFEEAGIPTSIMPRTAGCGVLRSSVYKKGATWHSVDSGYKPKAGDLVMYEKLVQKEDGNYYYVYAARDKNGVPDTTSHVGIVVKDFDESRKTYAVIDGNGNQGRVKYLADQKLYMAGPVYGGGTMNRIQGFITPAYTTGSGKGYDGGAGDTGSAKKTLQVTLTKATDPEYTAKEKVEETNAVVVSRIEKTAGSVVAASGITLRDADGSAIKDHRERVTNVSASTTVFHTWYDIQKELGVTLKPGTTYIYQFYVVVDNQTFRGEQYKLTTKGDPASYTAGADNAGDSQSPGKTAGAAGSGGTGTGSSGGSSVGTAGTGSSAMTGSDTANTGKNTPTSNVSGQGISSGDTASSGNTASSGKTAVSSQGTSSSGTTVSGKTTSSGKTAVTSQGTSSSDTAISGKTTVSGQGTNSSDTASSGKTTGSSQATGSGKTARSSRATISGRTTRSVQSTSADGSVSILAPSYHGTGTWITGMGGRAWRLQKPDGGYLASQWGLIDGTWYLFGNDGYTGTGWQKVDGAWYYFHPNAAMATGWVSVDGRWYHLNGSGTMETGWAFVDGRWYYLDASGAMRTGWQNVSGSWYYLDASGAMLANGMTPDGYWVDADGVWVR